MELDDKIKKRLFRYFDHVFENARYDYWEGETDFWQGLRDDEPNNFCLVGTTNEYLRENVWFSNGHRFNESLFSMTFHELKKFLELYLREKYDLKIAQLL